MWHPPFLIKRHLTEFFRLPSVRVSGLKVDSTSKAIEVDEHGAQSVFAGSETTIRLFGTGFTDNMVLAFTTEKADAGEVCRVFPVKGHFPVSYVAPHPSILDIHLKSTKVLGIYLLLKQYTYKQIKNLWE